jgi:hypothetical protein
MARLLLAQNFLFALLPYSASGNAFLHKAPAKALSSEQKSAILVAIEEGLGEKDRKATEVRLAPLEKMLAPTLNALPRNEHGRFGHKAARYALHRLFVQKHAWFVKGVGLDHDVSVDDENNVIATNNTTPASMLQDGVPDLIQSMFEEKLGAHGLDAHEVAVLAATLENLAHKEAMDRLRVAYEVLGLPTDSTTLTKKEVESIVDVYMAAYITGVNLTAAIEEKWSGDDVRATAEDFYPGWDKVRMFVREVMWVSEYWNRQAFSLLDVSHLVSRIGDQFGRWQAHECTDLKQRLLGVEDDGTGRVSLAKFYNSALNDGQWQFTEKIEYLRMLGAMDESKPASPRIIVSNYVLSPSNCIASSAFYSVCCMDECEELMDHLEQEIQAPAAKPELIASLVAKMPSSTTKANREIPAHLLTRLNDIASANEGVVPLHGRMFAQWLHHVYPRECPYPHLSGTTMAVRPEELDESLLTASAEEMQYYIDSHDHEAKHHHSEVMWSHEDELYVEKAKPSASSSWLRSFLRVVAFCAAAAATVHYGLRAGRKVEQDIYGFSKQLV